MSNETIRGNLVDAINELNKLLETCNDENLKFEIRIKIRELYQRLDRVIVATLDATTTEFADAIDALKSLTAKANKAKQDIDKVAAVINQAAKAISKVEKLITNVAGVLAIL
ncbi:conserved hypothetical protein [Candidatus Nitrotoga sp. BS]|uniref:hypothetical protein n=1 Tax=Candidatus Nitrotoga sp. BS TaxID=2890408 RepID=UPI001EF2EB71|nr:hypothetical protein [Candidatus Nitrotoga sp. BS]CAH1202634.1 conserved hypothetical protein [Candidatus Nitrotoga sp. BS]